MQNNEKVVITDKEAHNLLKEFAKSRDLRMVQVSGIVIKKGIEALKDATITQRIELSIDDEIERWR